MSEFGILPIRCYTCGKVLADKQDMLEQLIKEGKSAPEIYQILGITRYCCMTRMVNPIVLHPEVTVLPPGHEQGPPPRIREQLAHSILTEEEFARLNLEPPKSLPSISALQAMQYSDEIGALPPTTEELPIGFGDQPTKAIRLGQLPILPASHGQTSNVSFQPQIRPSTNLPISLIPGDETKSPSASLGSIPPLLPTPFTPALTPSLTSPLSQLTPVQPAQLTQALLTTRGQKQVTVQQPTITRIQGQPILAFPTQPLQQSFQQPLQQPLQQSFQQSFQQPLQQSFQQPLQQSFQQPLQQPLQQQQPFQQPLQQQPFQQPLQQQPFQQPLQQQPFQQPLQQQPFQQPLQQPLQQLTQQMQQLSIQPLPTQPLPTQPLPTQPLPTQPLPTQPLPTQPLPTQPLPTQPLPTQPLPTQQLPRAPLSLASLPMIPRTRAPTRR